MTPLKHAPPTAAVAEECTVGDTPATVVEVDSSEDGPDFLTCLAPAGPDDGGRVHVYVTTEFGRSAASDKATFAYPPPDTSPVVG